MKMSQLTSALNKLMRVTTFLAEGETDYPSLVLITPAPKQQETSLTSRITAAFSADAWLSDEVHVYFLDALDYRPLDPPLILKVRTSFGGACRGRGGRGGGSPKQHCVHSFGRHGPQQRRPFIDTP